MPNPVTQFQILSKTPDETAKFYVELLGWRVTANSPLEYRQINTGSEVGIQGGIWPAPLGAPNFVQLFVSVEDVTASVRKAWQRPRPSFRIRLRGSVAVAPITREIRRPQKPHERVVGISYMCSVRIARD